VEAAVVVSVRDVKAKAAVEAAASAAAAVEAVASAAAVVEAVASAAAAVEAVASAAAAAVVVVVAAAGAACSRRTAAVADAARTSVAITATTGDARRLGTPGRRDEKNRRDARTSFVRASSLQNRLHVSGSPQP
jgi:hypothetical protein